MALDETKKKLLLVLVGAFVLAYFVYQFVSGVFKGATALKAQGQKIESEIRTILADRKKYSKDWDDQMAEKEQWMNRYLPDSISSSETLKFLVRDCEKKFPPVRFTMVNPQPVVSSLIVADPENQALKLRMAKYGLKADLPPDLAIPYLEYIYAYPGAFRLSEFTLTKIEGGRIAIETTMDIYLAPGEWGPKNKKPEPELSPVSRELASVGNFFGNLDVPKEETPEETEQKKIQKRRAAPPPVGWPEFKIHQTVGESIVINERLLEVGDEIDDWTILRIAPSLKRVWVKKRDVTREMILP